MSEEISADQSSETRSLELNRVRSNRNVRLDVRIVRDITVVRYFISKLVFTEEKMDPFDIIVLYEAFESVGKKIATDTAFSRKYGFDIFLYRSIFQSLDSIQRKSPKQRYEDFEQFREFRGNKFASKSYFYIVRGQLNNLYKARVKQLQNRRPPPKRFIGMGYGDKGTAKNLSTDASPSWQEVSMVQGAENEPGDSRTSKELAWFQSLKVHPLQLW